MRKTIKWLGLILLTPLLTGCNLILLDAPGDVAAQQGDLIVYATVMMLLVIVPVMALTVFFAFKFRESNDKASYAPDWDHSVSLEIVIWAVPLAIIICLAGLTWVATHRLEPYNDVRRISATQAVDPSVEPLEVQVVALDWKWVFLYPEHDIATVNEVAAIVDRPIEFKLTSGTVMNSFAIPALAGQIYAMAGMETELNAVMNEPGTYEGFSANYSGNGFSDMRFEFYGLDEAGFEDWVSQVRAGGEFLDTATWLELEKKSTGNPITYYNGIEDGLWDKILNMCVGGKQLCNNDMMMVDALGGGGMEGLFNRELYKGFCSADDARALYLLLRKDQKKDAERILGAANGQSVLDGETLIYPYSEER
ncbi:MAG: ubiquinol oxidase subunit II [Pseudomonadota bacterium]